MDVADDYVSFEGALKELALTAEQLKRLVSEGEIRAIRGEQNSMKFRREEIERLKQDTGKTIQYTEPAADTLSDDLLFDESNDLDVSDEGMATAQISSGDTFVAKDKPAPKGGAKPPAKPAPAAKGPAKPPPAKTETKQAAASASATSQVRRTTGRSTRVMQAHAELAATGIGIGMVITSILTSVLLIFVSLVLLDARHDKPSSAMQGIADFCLEKFGPVKK